MLVLVLAVLAVSYASSLRAYLEQRDHLRTLEERIAQSEESIAALRREKRRWRDEAYVVAQARARFAFGFPGEIGYQVLDANGRPLIPDESLSAPEPAEELEPEWWQTAWTSIRTAGDPPPEPSLRDTITPPRAPRRDR